MDGGAWSHLVGAVICQVYSGNERDLGLVNSYAACYISEKYNVEVYGLDLSTNMIVIAWDRLQEIKSTKDLKVRFEIGDITKHTYPDEYFDYIYSRDVLLHIPKKEELLTKIKQWLKPDGKLFITDYACAPKPWSEEFANYVSRRGYSLLPVDEYETLFTNVGFKNVEAKDRTDLFIKYLKQELEAFQESKEDFLSEFTTENFDYLVESWKVKLERTNQGDQKWAIFSAQK